MEKKIDEQQKAVDEVYNYAANLIINENKSNTEVIKILIEQGIDEESASLIISNLEQQIKDAKKEQANKDILYGALWCVGGLIATVADFGYFFWGAILFGGYQFFKGIFNSYK